MAPMINAEKLLETLAKRREYIRECAKNTDAYKPVYRGRLFENESIAQIVEDMAATPVDPVKVSE